MLQALQKAVPAEFELMGQRKGFVRYYSPALRALVKQHADALESRELALSGILQVGHLHIAALCLLYMPVCAYTDKQAPPVLHQAFIFIHSFIQTHARQAQQAQLGTYRSNQLSPTSSVMC